MKDKVTHVLGCVKLLSKKVRFSWIDSWRLCFTGVCLSFRLFVCFQLYDRVFIKISRNVSVDKEELIEFRKYSTSGSGSRNFFTIIVIIITFTVYKLCLAKRSNKDFNDSRLHEL